MNKFLENIIKIENLFNSVYNQEQKKNKKLLEQNMH